MARQDLNLFERHVEKLTVGLTAALLLWVAYAYMVKSPNRVQLEGASVGPKEVDLRVRDAGENLLRRYASADAAAVEVEDYSGRQKQLARGPLANLEIEGAANLRRSVSFGVPAPMVEGLGSLGQVTLATLAPPEKPVVDSGRLSALFPPRAVPIGEQLTDQEIKLMQFDGPEDRIWVTVASRFDLEKQKAVFLAHNYQTDRFKIVAEDVQLQRQRRLENGEWGPWDDVNDYTEFVMDPVPPLNLVPDGQQYKIPPEQQQALGVWYGNLTEFEIDLVRPRLPDPVHGPKWYPPLAKRLSQLYPTEVWTYVEPEAEEPGRKRKLSTLQQAKADLAEARELLDEGLLDEAQAKVDAVIKSKLSSRHPLRREANDLDRDIVEAIRKRRLQEITQQDDGEEGEPERTEEIYLAHDLEAQAGSTYRYRTRVKVFNQYATILQRLAQPEDATRVYVFSEWSPASDPVTIPAIQRVYLASANEDKNQAQFDIFRWYKGQWVDASFRTNVGERIAGSRRVQHAQLGRVEVEFDTGAVFLDLEPERVYVPAKTQRDGTVRLGEPETTPAAVCQGENGEVFELLLADRNDEERRRIEEEIDQLNRVRRPKPAQPPAGRPGRPPGGGRGGGRGGG